MIRDDQSVRTIYMAKMIDTPSASQDGRGRNVQSNRVVSVTLPKGGPRDPTELRDDL
jgi:hypothetical protein